VSEKTQTLFQKKRPGKKWFLPELRELKLRGGGRSEGQLVKAAKIFFFENKKEQRHKRSAPGAPSGRNARFRRLRKYKSAKKTFIRKKKAPERTGGISCCGFSKNAWKEKGPRQWCLREEDANLGIG